MKNDIEFKRVVTDCFSELIRMQDFIVMLVEMKDTIDEIAEKRLTERAEELNTIARDI